MGPMSPDVCLNLMCSSSDIPYQTDALQTSCRGCLQQVLGAFLLYSRSMVTSIDQLHASLVDLTSFLTVRDAAADLSATTYQHTCVHADVSATGPSSDYRFQ